MTVFSLIIILPVLLILTILLLVEIFWKASPDVALNEVPKVSVLVCARDEEGTIEECLEALLEQNYPKDKIEILIADDQSADATAVLARRFAASYDNVRFFSIQSRLNDLAGKTNVLAQLAHEAIGDYYFICDADVQVPSNWIRQMLGQSDNETGLVTGVTFVEKGAFLGGLQCIDWLYALGMIHLLSRAGIAVTAMGNNMMVRKEAYWQTGGYENIGFSVTEDFALLKAVRKEGWKAKTLYKKSVLAATMPQSSLFSLLFQRKRWMHGALRTQWAIRLLLVFQALYYPAMVLLFLYNQPLAVVLLTAKWVLQASFIEQQLKKLNLEQFYWQSFIYEIYASILSVSLLFFYLIPTGISWKRRRY